MGRKWVGVMPLGLAFWVCLGWGVRATEVTAVAKVGDGSTADVAYGLLEKKIKTEMEGVSKDASECQGPGNSSKTGIETWISPEHAGETKVIESKGIVKMGISTSSLKTAECGENNEEVEFLKPEWIIQAKPLILKPGYSSKGYRTHAFRGDGRWFGFCHIHGYDDHQWVTVQTFDDSGAPSWIRNSTPEQTILNLKKAGHSISQALEDQFKARLGNTDLAGLWRAVEKDPKDLAAAGRFFDGAIQALKDHIAAWTALSEDPGYWKNVPGAMANLNMEVSGTGSLSTSMVLGQDGKTQLVITMEGKALGDACAALVQAVNSTYQTNLEVPVISAGLKDQLVSAKLTLSGPDGAIEKLANAAGLAVKIEGGKTILEKLP